MRKLKLFFACLLMAVLSIGQMWGADEVVYTLTPASGSNNSYTGNCDVEIDGITWNLEGNSQQNPWRIGGGKNTGLSNVNRAVYSKTAMDNAITKVELTVGTASGITVNSLKLIVASNADFSSVIEEVTETFAANSKITFTPESPATEWAANAFYKFVFNVSVSGTSNKYLEFTKADFYAEESTGGDVIVKTLESIAVDGMTTAYEVGDVFSFDGTCTATYSVTKNSVPQDDEEKTVTPTEVTAPDMSTPGVKTITVSYTESEVTKETTYDITVSAASGDKLTTTNTSNPSTYQAWPDEVSGAVAKYMGYSTGGTEKIQMRTNDNASGIVSTSTGGLISKVKVTWQTSTGRTLDIYGYDKPYTAASELYGTGSKGTKIGSIVYGTSTQFTYTDDAKYPYVGVRSSSGALYLTDITFEWDPVSEISIKTAPSTVTYDEDDNFDPTDLVITATYESGKTLDIAYADVQDFTFSPALTEALTTSDVNVSITYGGQSVNQAITVNAKACTPTDLAYAETAVEKLDNDDNFTHPLTLTTGQTVAYAGDNNDVATVNPTTGEVDIVGAGTVHITASVEEEEISSTTYCAKSVSYTLTVTAAPVATGTFELFEGALEEGDYVIYNDKRAMNTSINNGRLQYAEVTPVNDEIENPDASTVWHIAQSGEYWTIYNSAANAYAAGTGADNKAQMLADGTDDKALWTITGSAAYKMINKYNDANSKNDHLQNNGTYGFACYSEDAYGSLTLYKKAAPAAPYAVTLATCTNGSVGATAASAISSGDDVLSGTTITLSNTPTSGYQLVAYDVYKTGEPTTKVTVKEDAGVYTFKMPAYAVTISATFSEILILDHITLSGEYQTTFWQGVPFNSNNLVATASYENAEDAVVTPTSITDPDMSTPGVKTITVSYTEGTITKEKSYDITVRAVPSTLENPYTVAEARSLYDAYNAASIAQPTVYVKGVVTGASMETGGSAPAAYKNKAYNVYVKAENDDSETPTTFEFYHMLDGRTAETPVAFTNGDITVGDTLVAVGKLKKYNSIYEFDAGCSLKVRKEFNQPLVDISNTKETAYTPAQAIALYNNPTSDLTKEVYVIGVVSGTPSLVSGKTDEDAKWNGTYNVYVRAIGDESENPTKFEFYRMYSDDSEGKFSEEDIIEFDTIIAKGLLSKYNTTYEFAQGCEMVEQYKYHEPAVAVESITLVATKTVKVGKSVTLVPTFEPANATNKNVTWTILSGDDKITLSNAGVVTGEAEGEAVVQVETEDGHFTATCTITVTAGVNFNNGVWQLVTDASTLSANDYLVIVSNATGKEAVAGDISSQIMASVDVAFSADKKYIQSLPSDAVILTLGGTSGAWTLANEDDELLGATAAKKLAWDEGTTTWSISIADNNATIQNGKNEFGRFLYNSNSGQERFTTYTSDASASMLLPQLYRFTTTLEDYTRPVTNGNFGTICLPYAGTISGATLFELSGKDADHVYVDELGTSLEAGKPYVFLASADQITVTYNAFVYTEPSASGYKGLHGTFVDLSGNDLIGTYLISNNQYYNIDTDNCSLNAYRAYFMYDEIDQINNNQMPVRRRFALGNGAPQVATGVDTLNASETPVKMIIDGQLYILRGEKLFDATGRLVK